MTIGLPEIAAGILLPFVGTSLGAAATALFGRKRKTTVGTNAVITGFSAGIMTAAAVWSLLIPACTLAEKLSIPEWLPCISGFLTGVIFMLLTDAVTSSKNKTKSNGTFMLIFAITVHNIPEGMAVGAAISGCRASDAVSTAAAAALCVGIAIQNIPEGAVVSLPAYADGKSKGKSFALGVLSGAVEPAGAILTLLFTSHMLPILPYLLSFAAGAMVFTVFGELLPEVCFGEKRTTLKAAISACAGFALMMLLDIALG